MEVCPAFLSVAVTNIMTERQFKWGKGCFLIFHSWLMVQGWGKWEWKLWRNYFLPHYLTCSTSCSASFLLQPRAFYQGNAITHSGRHISLNHQDNSSHTPTYQSNMDNSSTGTLFQLIPGCVTLTCKANQDNERNWKLIGIRYLRHGYWLCEHVFKSSST